MMNTNDIKTFSEFLAYFQNESDRGAALIGAAMVESRLERIFENTLINNSSKENVIYGSNALLGTFSSKIQMAHVLGFLSEKEYKEVNLIRKIRNEFAHKLEDLHFSNSPICDLCLNLTANTPEDYKKLKQYRNIFINSVI